MRNKETILGLAFLLLGNGGAGFMAILGNGVPALIASAISTVAGGALLIYGLQFKEAKSPAIQRVRFSQADARNLYEQFNESIRELRKEARNIVKDKPGMKFFEDERYLKIMDDISKARQRCTDSKLNDLLTVWLKYETQCAMFGFSPIEHQNGAELELYQQRIRDHINKNIKG